MIKFLNKNAVPKNNWLIAFSVVFLLSSCVSTQKIGYFQDMQLGKSEQRVVSPVEIKIRTGDKIFILVSSRDPLLGDLFNLPIAARQVGLVSNSGYHPTQGLSGYTVDVQGDIDFPIMGKMHVAGKKREEIAAYVQSELITRNLVKDPVVTVEFMNLCISVIGEVNHPGRYNVDRDRITLLDALSMAGDLTIYGKRDKVLVLREEDGVEHAYEMNLCSAEQIYSSPAYYLQQNDVVYVEPNTVRARQSTVNGNNVRSTSFWISLASLLTTVSVLLLK